MTARIPDSSVAKVFSAALKGGALVDEGDTSIIFYDITHMRARVDALKAAFPPATLHATAIKANPLLKIMRQLAALDLGFEAASLPELVLAERTGAAANRIVFDSPAKTVSELRRALELGCHINADSLAELDRIATLIEGEGVETASTIGVRVNPQVGDGRIASTSVAGLSSKFGVALAEQGAALVDRFARHAWLEGLHLHIGSQGCSMPLLLGGIERVLELANTIDATLAAKGERRRVRIFDIGGGLPVAYHPDATPDSMQSYAEAIGRRFGDLFSGRFRLITEFGRYVHANSGWVASRVEYVKEGQAGKTLIVHVGADLLLRKCYSPADWHHEIMVVDSRGNPKAGIDDSPYTVAGPPCFAGDILARGIRLPVVNEGDYVLIRDTGAYTLSMWSRYNSRQVPKVVGYTDEGEQFELLRERETVEQAANFWE